MMLDQLKEQITQLIDAHIDKAVFVLDRVQVRPSGHKLVVSVTMDRTQGGITLDECADWNRKLGDFIEESGLIQGAYVIEVASPGLDRPIESQKDFERVLGKRLKVCYRNSEGAMVGGVFRLVSVYEKGIIIDGGENTEKINISFERIDSAKQNI